MKGGCGLRTAEAPCLQSLSPSQLLVLSPHSWLAWDSGVGWGVITDGSPKPWGLRAVPFLPTRLLAEGERR